MKSVFVAVVDLAVVAALERPLRQAVRRVLVLDVLGGEPQLAVQRLDVERQMAGRRAVQLAVLGGHEVRSGADDSSGRVQPQPFDSLR